MLPGPAPYRLRGVTIAPQRGDKLLKGLGYVPRVLITDKVASYGVAHKEMLPSTEHRRATYLNKRAENSHQPIGQKERAMKRFTSAGHAQRLLSAFSGISGHFRPRWHRLSACAYRAERATRVQAWQEITDTVAT